MEDFNENRRRFLCQAVLVAAGAAFGTGVADAAPTQQRQGIIQPPDSKTAGACILIRGADGALYFIPDDKLGAFRLPTGKAEAVRKGVEPEDLTGTCKIMPGTILRRAGLTATFVDMFLYVNLGAIRQRRR